MKELQNGTGSRQCPLGIRYSGRVAFEPELSSHELPGPARQSCFPATEAFVRRGKRWTVMGLLAGSFAASAAGASGPQITEFSAGLTGSSPVAIVATPDGNLW